MSEKEEDIKKIAPNVNKSDETSFLPYEIDISQILLHSRQIFLYGEIDEKLTKEINQALIGLSYIDTKSIVMWINSPGGCIVDGLSIIDTMLAIKVPVITIINGIAASMAGIISVVGDKRIITKNAYWMAHEGFGGGNDYFSKLQDRQVFYKSLNNRTKDILKKYTKLTNNDIEKCQKGEVWLNATQALKKGIVDNIG